MTESKKRVLITLGFFILFLLLANSAFAGGYVSPVKPAGLISSLEDAVINITNWLLGFVVLLAILALVWGGIQYIFSAGNEEGARNGKRIITYAIIGLIITGGSYAMVAVIVKDVVTMKGPRITNAAVTPTSGLPGTTFTITATITAADGVNSAMTKAHIQNPDESDIAGGVITLFDDGAHGDGAAGDDVYGNTWNSGAAPQGPYFVDINACDMAGNCAERENI